MYDLTKSQIESLTTFGVRIKEIEDAVRDMRIPADSNTQKLTAALEIASAALLHIFENANETPEFEGGWRN